VEPAHYSPDLVHRAFMQAVDPRSLHLILFVTEQCNFRCTYCYEEFKRNGMKPEVIEGVQNLVDRRGPNLDHLSISWFGGEPLLAQRTILSLCRSIEALSVKHGFARQDSITTNGFLLDTESARRLIDARVSTFQISLDGPADYHDSSQGKRRRYFRSHI
jgi:uncharacterized protein